MKTLFGILIVLTVLAAGALGVVQSLRPPAPPRHEIAAVVAGDPIDAPLARDPLPPVTTQIVYNPGAAVPGSNLLPKITAPSKPENAAYAVLSWDPLTSYPYERWWLKTDAKLDQPPPDQIPRTVRALAGKAVILTGFMNPLDPDEKGMVSRFMLMRNQTLCCYGGPITLLDWAEVRMADGRRVKPTMHTPVFVLGKIDVGEDMSNGYPSSLYRMTADRVLPPGELP